MQKENEEKGKNGGKENDGSKNKEEKTMYTNSQPITEFLREEIKKSTKWRDMYCCTQLTDIAFGEAPFLKDSKYLDKGSFYSFGV